MIRPLRDRIVVRPLDEVRVGLIEVVKLDSKVSRGEIMACGPEARDCAPGDVIQFTDIFKFPQIIDHGEKLLILQEADICAIEDAEAVDAAA